MQIPIGQLEAAIDESLDAQSAEFEAGGPTAELDGQVDMTTDEEIVGVAEEDFEAEDALEFVSSLAGQQETTPEQAEAARKLEASEQEYIDAGLDVQRIEEEIDRLKTELKEAREFRDACGVRLRKLRQDAGVEAADSNGIDSGDDGDGPPPRS